MECRQTDLNLGRSGHGRKFDTVDQLKQTIMTE